MFLGKFKPFIIFLNTCVVVFIAPFAFGENTKGFWQGKDRLLQRAYKNREILVYVHEINIQPRKKLILQAMGVIHLPTSEAARLAADYKNLKKLSDVITSMDYNAKRNLLILDTRAFNYKSKFTIKTQHSLKKQKPEIAWKVIGGFFKGMSLKFVFSPLGPQKSQIALYGEHQYKTLGIPTFFIEFGMEVIMQQAAKRLRSVIETDFRKET